MLWRWQWEKVARGDALAVKPSANEHVTLSDDLHEFVLIVELTLRSPIFTETFERCPETALSVDSQHLLEDGTIQMLVWMDNSDVREFEGALDDDWTIRDYRRLATESGRVLYRIRFSDRAADYSVHHRWTELGGALLDATGTSDGWDLRMRFPDRSAVQSFYRRCGEKEVDVSIEALYTTLDDTTRGFGLTEKQYDAIRLAFEEGYFDVPRAVNLTELASTVDVSRQSFSRRLTRGLHNLVENTLIGATDG